ncbi:exported hypothetical protein [Agrobacterium fabacearum CFBP 5771]|nr:exported hypothetical protein [Agrobacterium fabacearum CFBP 5771]
MPSRRSILKSALTGLVTAPFVAPSITFAKAPYAGVQAPGFYRLKIGSAEVTALSDGTIPLPLSKLYTNTSQQHAQSVLSDAFLPESVPTSVNAFLVNTGDRLVLIDAGTGTYMGPSLGKLAANIEASGYKVDDIDDVVLTHIHTDHSGGLVSNGKRSFPNATLRVNEREAKFWLSADNANGATGIVKQQFAEADQCVTPYVKAEKFETFADTPRRFPVSGPFFMRDIRRATAPSLWKAKATRFYSGATSPMATSCSSMNPASPLSSISTRKPPWLHATLRSSKQWKADIWWEARTLPFRVSATCAKTARITTGCPSTTLKLRQPAIIR